MGDLAITLRKLPPELQRRIRRRAKERGISLNRAVIELLEANTGRRPEPVHEDLDFLVGAWSEEEADVFEQELSRQRETDPELWK